MSNTQCSCGVTQFYVQENSIVVCSDCGEVLEEMVPAAPKADLVIRIVLKKNHAIDAMEKMLTIARTLGAADATQINQHADTYWIDVPAEGIEASLQIQHLRESLTTCPPPAGGPQ